MDVEEEDTSSFKESQNGNEVNNISICQQEKEQEENKEKMPENTVPHEQNSQLKESFQYGYSLFRDQQSNNIGQAALNLQDEEEILKECQKIDSINITQQNINSLVSENPLTILFWSLSSKGLLTSQFIESIERVFIKKIIQINQQGRLKDIDDKMRIALSKLTDLHFLRYPYMHFQPSFIIKEEAPYENTHENSLFSPQKVKDKLLPKQQYNGSLKSIKVIVQQFTRSNQRIMKKEFLYQKGHQLFSNFLNDSMKRLNIEKAVKAFCKSIKAWTSGHSTGHSVASFLKKLVAIKSFFPDYFQKISKQFFEILQKFKFSETKNEVQTYAKKMLTSRYQNCMKIYTESDDILTAAEQLYKKSRQSSFGTKILLFYDYQIQIKQKARKLEIQKQSQC